jgi:hypothetical protein
MEVHPPHEPVHSWREALIHIGLMTIGLFIALMLEGLVEYMHHKHLVHEARENIRRELQANDKAAKDDVQNLQDNTKRVQAGIDTLHFMRHHPQAKNQKIEFTMSYEGLSDAAYRTARDTGALGYMSYDEVQRYAGLYAFQEQISTQATSILQHEAETIAPILATESEDFSQIPAGQYDDMLRSSGVNLMDVRLLTEFMQELDQQYVDALKH